MTILFACFALTIVRLGPRRRSTWLVMGMLALPTGWSLVIGQAQVVVTLHDGPGGAVGDRVRGEPQDLPGARRDLVGRPARRPVARVVRGLDGRADRRSSSSSSRRTLAIPVQQLGLGQVGDVENRSLYALSPIVWAIAVAAGVIVAWRLAPTRYGLGGRGGAVSVFATPRLLIYQLSTLVAALREPDSRNGATPMSLRPTGGARARSPWRCSAGRASSGSASRCSCRRRGPPGSISSCCSRPAAMWPPAESPYDPAMVRAAAPGAADLFFSYPPPVAQSSACSRPCRRASMLRCAVGPRDRPACCGRGAHRERSLRPGPPGRRAIAIPTLAVAPLFLPSRIALLFGNLDALFPLRVRARAGRGSVAAVTAIRRGRWRCPGRRDDGEDPPRRSRTVVRRAAPAGAQGARAARVPPRPPGGSRDGRRDHRTQPARWRRRAVARVRPGRRRRPATRDCSTRATSALPRSSRSGWAATRRSFARSTCRSLSRPSRVARGRLGRPRSADRDRDRGRRVARRPAGHLVPLPDGAHPVRGGGGGPGARDAGRRSHDAR